MNVTECNFTRGRLWAVLLLLPLLVAGCGSGSSSPYEENFDSAGNWGSGFSDEVDGEVVDGVYQMHVKTNHGMYLATAGERFANGIYSVEATQIDGPLNNGFGMLFRVDDETDSYYVFEISGDGYVWIGWCSALCEEEIPLVGGDWFPSPAVEKGLQETNRLRVVADGPWMTFFVNGTQVGRTSDSRLAEGDIAVMVEALGEPGASVAFDNFTVTPPSEE